MEAAAELVVPGHAALPVALVVADRPCRAIEVAEDHGVAGLLVARESFGAGFDRVFLTILDTHIASLIAAAFLFQFGTGPIRGFATTLTIGLLSNVFTAVFVSRTVFELVLSRRRQAQTLSI